MTAATPATAPLNGTWRISIAALRLKKTALGEAQYDAQMEKLLTDLALKTKAIRDLQAAKKDER